MSRTYSSIKAVDGHFDFANPNEEQTQVRFYWADYAPDEVKQLVSHTFSDCITFYDWEVVNALEEARADIENAWFYSGRKEKLAVIDKAIQYMIDNEEKENYYYWKEKYDKCFNELADIEMKLKKAEEIYEQSK